MFKLTKNILFMLFKSNRVAWLAWLINHVRKQIDQTPANQLAEKVLNLIPDSFEQSIGQARLQACLPLVIDLLRKWEQHS